MKKALITDANSEYRVFFTVSMIKLRNLRLRRWRPSCWWGGLSLGTVLERLRFEPLLVVTRLRRGAPAVPGDWQHCRGLTPAPFLMLTYTRMPASNQQPAAGHEEMDWAEIPRIPCTH